jgi:hypothetical protein
MAPRFDSFGGGGSDSFLESPGLERDDPPSLGLFRLFYFDVLTLPELVGHVAPEDGGYSSASEMLLFVGTGGTIVPDPGTSTIPREGVTLNVPMPFGKLEWTIRGMAETIDETLPETEKNTGYSAFFASSVINQSQTIVINKALAGGQSGGVLNINRKLTHYLPGGSYQFFMIGTSHRHPFRKSLPEVGQRYISANWTVTKRNSDSLNPLNIVPGVDQRTSAGTLISQIQCLQMDLIGVRVATAAEATALSDA